MKERPILFSAPMVRAILDGRKTQTRRIVNRVNRIGLITDFQRSDTTGYDWSMRDKYMRWNEFGNANLLERCPHGKTGDRLWVRETFLQDTEGFIYRADGDFEGNAKILGGWKPSIHMPRSASRILLEITGVRVERLQDISEEDAVAEGLPSVKGDSSAGFMFEGVGYHGAGFDRHKQKTYHTPTKNGKCSCIFGGKTPAQCAYRELWESINGHGSWDLNPWVWVIEFKVLECEK